MNRRRRIVSALFHPSWRMAACLVLVSGCGGGNGDLRGKVNFQGKPVRMGSVLAAGADGVVRSGVIQDDGSYFIAQLPTGTAKVAVNSPDPSSRTPTVSKKTGLAKPLPDQTTWFAIPDPYGDFAQSGLTVTVRRGANAFDIDLK